MKITSHTAFRILLLLCWAVVGSSCASRKVYDSIETGSFDGSLNLQWISPEKFVFIPDPERPFTFTRASGEIIQPQAMFTDVGSLPRFLTVDSDFSSMGYAPAYIIHDWLYVDHTKAANSGDPHDINRSALILAEGLKTLMESNNTIRRKPRTLNLIYRSLKSPFAHYATHISPWHTDLSSPENVAVMGSKFYQSSSPENPAPATKISREKTNIKALVKIFFPPFSHLKTTENAHTKAQRHQE